MNALLKGLIRGGQARNLDGFAEFNELRELIVAQGLPPYTDATRRGTRYGTMATAAVAGLVVRPTTTAAIEIYNNTANAGKPRSWIVDRVFTQWLVSTNVVEAAILYAMVTLPKVAPTDNANAVNSFSGKPASTKELVVGVGTTVVDNGWFPWGQAFTKGAGGVVPFGGIVAEVGGRMIVPPGSSLCLHVLSSLVGDTFTSGADGYLEAITGE